MNNSNMTVSAANKPAVQRPRFSVAIQTKDYQKLIQDTLGDAGRAKRFVAGITSAVAVNPDLQQCEASTVLAGALLGESLGLSPSPQLGQYYLVPFKQKAKHDRTTGELISPETVKAQFVLGYKGYIQLAIRSGNYKKLNVLEIKEGELVRFDPLTEEIECRLIQDYEAREAAPTVGYYAMFEYTNGFRKAIYWSKEKMIAHADAYSPAFSAVAYKRILAGEIPERDMWKYSSFWYKNFDDMAKKTMLRQLISKWGVMSAEMVSAMTSDAGYMDIGASGELVTTAEDHIDIAPEVSEDPTASDNPEPPKPFEGGDEVESVNLDEI